MREVEVKSLSTTCDTLKNRIHQLETQNQQLVNENVELRLALGELRESDDNSNRPLNVITFAPAEAYDICSCRCL